MTLKLLLMIIKVEKLGFEDAEKSDVKSNGI